ncbi:zinc finger-homeodomain-containing protein [Cinnamomum micranthum f. kanehirae]|uniref:Zinc finger-homeodomain-containing protein n=1 Tax=Cinnamomum micranthum f. kanehirae TaxID=337451 RepID=A0A3S3N9A0_9MAGN|nr:zinc finger-homeodomain-containing protein [Cinnamomum micranthum f. kanehirae]
MESDNNTRELHRECLRNHAARLGSYATDGCGEFIPDNSIAGGLQCAACGCHRNFHRKLLVACSAHEEATGNVCQTNSPAAADSAAKKRFRTKFSAEQKEKMFGFAERIGWRLQKKENGEDHEEEIRRFCREVGVSKQVFKVWMHNHKNSSSSASPPALPNQ